MNVTVLWQGGVLLCAVFLLTVLGEAFLVPRLRRFAAQPILEIGPRWHLSKSGTPTLGGLGFIFAMLLSVLAFLPFWIRRGDVAWQKPLFLLSFGLACGVIGFLDDWKKLLGKQNKGLSAAQKFLLQLLVSALFLFFAAKGFGLSTTLALPFSESSLEMGVFYYPFALFFLTGMINALNLTDGVDGLLSALVGVFCGYLLLFSMRHGEELGFLCGCLLLGGVLGFLCFNAHPAKIFMGDTGSLFLGGIVAGYAILSSNTLCVLIACGVFLIEAFSVILQVLYFKLTKGKRLFLMAPLHHHLEKKGWSEERVVLALSAVGIALSLIAFFGG